MGKYSIPMDSILLPLFYLTPYGAGASELIMLMLMMIIIIIMVNYGDDHSS